MITRAQSNAIVSIVESVIEQREALSKLKWSGVHKVENYLGADTTVFRIHESDLLPKFITQGIPTRKYAAIINQNVPHVEFDPSSLWLTIEEIS